LAGQRTFVSFRICVCTSYTDIRTEARGNILTHESVCDVILADTPLAAESERKSAWRRCYA
jgi:hypothetical protein